ncbi:MAG: hypothetical protein N4A33_11250 [Bacteriovoracaceae bacterium]|jgi:hypothetical protein|nr:hypothetical protein [Bacteriovoracaceae bacterium]
MKKLALLTCVTAMTSAIAFEPNNNPSFIGSNYDYEFRSLPLDGQLSSDKTPWSSSFWPHIYGGIAFRWNNYHTTVPYFAQLHYKINDINAKIEKLNSDLYTTSMSSYEMTQTMNEIISLKNLKIKVNSQKSAEHQKELFSYKRPRTLKDVQNMSEEQVYKLSPAEKFDVYKMLMGTSSRFRLTKDVLNLTGPYKAYWEGICHGWSTAAIEFEEPTPVTINKKGVKLTLNSSDLKGLLSYYHAAITRNIFARRKAMRTGFIGKKCGVTFPAETWSLENGIEYYRTIENGKVVKKVLPPECIDVNAGAFHVVIANQISLKKEGFVAEAVRDREIWNQPVFGYDSQILDEAPTLYVKKTKGTAKQVKVKTIMKYANDGGRMYWGAEAKDDEFYAWENPTNGTDNYRWASKEYEYILDLDRRGKIIGGHWLSYERPDFLWIKKSKGFIKTKGISGYMEDIKNLVKLR